MSTTTTPSEEKCTAKRQRIHKKEQKTEEAEEEPIDNSPSPPPPPPPVDSDPLQQRTRRCQTKIHMLQVFLRSPYCPDCEFPCSCNCKVRSSRIEFIPAGQELDENYMRCVCINCGWDLKVEDRVCTGCDVRALAVDVVVASMMSIVIIIITISIIIIIIIIMDSIIYVLHCHCNYMSM